VAVFKRSKHPKVWGEGDDWDAEPQSIARDFQTASMTLQALDEARRAGSLAETDIVSLYTQFVNSIGTGVHRADEWLRRPRQRHGKLLLEVQDSEYRSVLRGLILPIRGLHDGLAILDTHYPEFNEVGEKGLLVAKSHIIDQFARLRNIPSLSLTRTNMNIVEHNRGEVKKEIEANRELYDELRALVEFSGVAKLPHYGPLPPQTELGNALGAAWEVQGAALEFIKNGAFKERIEEVVPRLVSVFPESAQSYFGRGFTVGYHLVRGQESLGWPFRDPFRDEAFWSTKNVPPHYLPYGGIVSMDQGKWGYGVRTDWRKQDFVDLQTWAGAQIQYAEILGDGSVPLRSAKTVAWALRCGVYYGVNESSESVQELLRVVNDGIGEDGRSYPAAPVAPCGPVAPTP
jgi:hypothetical protein